MSLKNTKGALVEEIIDQYKNSNKFFIINFAPNRFYCLTGFWIEEVNPGIFQSIFYEKVRKKLINTLILSKKLMNLLKISIQNMNL